MIDADVSFNGVNKYASGTALTSEYVRVLRLNNGGKDLGAKSLNSGALSVTPEADYKFHFFFNSSGPSSTYYVDTQDYTAKIQDSVDNVVGQGCAIDTDPTVTVRTSSGQTQTAASNAQAISAAATVNVEVDIRAHTDKCYGTPNAPKGNAICFGYDTTYFTTVKPNTKWISVPRSVTGLSLGTVKCYEFATIADGQRETLTVKLTANAEPTTAHNISIYIDDISFDLNADNLAEIWDFTDESGNQLSDIISSTADGYIRVS